MVADSQQRWSRGHKARGLGQGHKKIPGQGQPFQRQTLSRPKTGMLEAKANEQGHKCTCPPNKKKVFKPNFQVISKKKVLKNFFQAIHKILTIQKIVLSSSRVQGNFRGLEALRPRTWPSIGQGQWHQNVSSRPTDVFGDSTSDS